MERDCRFSFRKWSVDLGEIVLGGVTLALAVSSFLHDGDIEMRMCGHDWVENSKVVCTRIGFCCKFRGNDWLAC
jgi:hypothetical protein